MYKLAASSSYNKALHRVIRLLELFYMDGNSIITQVSANNNTPNIYDTDIQVANPFRNTITSNQKNKQKRKSLFRSLLCCFSSRREEIKLSSGNDTNILISNDKSLLPQIRNCDSGKKCLIIDLDETLVHSSFKPVSNADFIVPVEIEGITHQVYVLKRPYVDEFLQKMGQLFECILFTASLAKYADPVCDLLDKWNVFRARLFREACVYYRGNYVKDLSKLGRDLNSVIICDNSPASYIFHPDNAVPVSSWFDDPNDNELEILIPFMEKLASSQDIYSFLKQGNLDTFEAISNNTVYIQQSQQIYSDQKTIQENEGDELQLEQSYLINKKSSSFNKINYLNNNDDNSNKNANDYTINETSIVLSMDITSSLNTFQKHANELNEK